MPSTEHKFTINQVVKYRIESKPGYAESDRIDLGVIQGIILTPRGPRYTMSSGERTVSESNIISVIDETPVIEAQP